MAFQITIKPSEHSFTCDDGETVLASAMRADLMLPYGCRNGACGTCKGKLLDGVVDYGVHQKSTLSDDEKHAGLALFCCATPRTDLVIEVREVRRAGDIRIKRLPCRIESIDKPVPDVAIVKLKLPVNERLQYLAGQYIDFLLKDGKRRSFSLATAPHDDQLLELHIRHVPNGFFTDLLFAQYKGREILRFEGPLGAFYLREDSDKPAIFVTRAAMSSGLIAASPARPDPEPDERKAVMRTTPPNRNASGHACEVGHPIARSAEAGEHRSSCFVAELAFVGPGEAR